MQRGKKDRGKENAEAGIKYTGSGHEQLQGNTAAMLRAAAFIIGTYSSTIRSRVTELTWLLELSANRTCPLR